MILAMLAFSAFTARAQYDVVTQPIMSITTPGVQPGYVAGSNIGQYAVGDANVGMFLIGSSTTSVSNTAVIGTYDNVANSTLTPGTYSCGGYTVAGKGHVQPLSAPDHWWPDSLDLYYEAMKYQNSGSDDSELQKGLDTMRLYVQEHPYADNNLTIDAINQTGIFLSYMGREDSSLNDKLQYNWLIHAMLWNMDTAYQDEIWSSLASIVTWDPNLEANVWYNNIIRFQHPVMDWEAIETIRKSQRASHPPEDTTPFYIMNFPPDTIPINAPAGVTNNSRSAASASLVLNPNPASTKLTVDFTLVQGGQAQILIYDETGNMIRAITNGPHPSGLNEVTIPLSDLSNGHYFVRLASDGNVVTKELIVQH